MRSLPMSFGIQRGLSTHERYAHPATRNIKRRGTDLPNTRYWKVEEVNLVREFNEIYKYHKFPNVEISKILTTKTIEQIKKMRQAIKACGEEVSSEVVTHETEGGCDAAISGNEPETNVMEYLDEESINEWRRCLKIAIEKTSEVTPSTQKLYNELKKVWDDFKEDQNILAAKLDKFVGISLHKRDNAIKGSRIPVKNVERAQNNNRTKNKKITGISGDVICTHVARICLKNVRRSWPML